MIEVKEVCTRRQKKDFLDFPVNLDKGGQTKIFTERVELGTW